jgi:hypothetical protein
MVLQFVHNAVARVIATAAWWEQLLSKQHSRVCPELAIDWP